MLVPCTCAAFADSPCATNALNATAACATIVRRTRGTGENGGGTLCPHHQILDKGLKNRISSTFQLVKKDFDKLVDGEASSPARCRVSNLRFEPSAVSPSAKPENPLGFQPSCHPYQFLLKSFRFPGAKTARKRFLLWKMGFSAAKILPCPPYMPLGTIEIREGFGPLELSEGFSTV